MLEICAIHYDDLYFREVAADVLDAVRDIDEETCAVAIVCIAYNAECNLSRN